jgi:uncharacterized membrane protein
MPTLVKTFLNGLLAFLPMFVTVYAIYYFGLWLDRFSSELVHTVAPGLPYVPGIGIGVGVVAILLLGVLVSSGLTRWIYNLAEIPLTHLPVVKELYVALKQLTEFLKPGGARHADQVVSVRHPDFAVSLVGLMMRRDMDGLDERIAARDCVAVYLPLSYQIGGYTLFIPRDWVTPIDMSVEQAMRASLTGWMQVSEEA